MWLCEADETLPGGNETRSVSVGLRQDSIQIRPKPFPIKSCKGADRLAINGPDSHRRIYVRIKVSIQEFPDLRHHVKGGWTLAIRFEAFPNPPGVFDNQVQRASACRVDGQVSRIKMLTDFVLQGRVRIVRKRSDRLPNERTVCTGQM